MKVRIYSLIALLALTSLFPTVAWAGERFYRHVVLPGDTLWGLTRIYGVEMEALRAANNLSGNTWLYPGQTITIPLTLDYTPSRVRPFLYVVQPAQTLGAIAWRFEITLDTLKRANAADDGATFTTRPVPGTTLLIPAGPHYYRLAPGETLADVAKLYGVSVAYLERFNPTVQAGQDVYVPIQYSKGEMTSTANAVPGQGGPLAFRWFSIHRITARGDGRAELILLAEFRGGQPPYTLTVNDGQVVQARGPYPTADNGEVWSDLAFDWSDLCGESFVLSGTLKSADGQEAFMANLLGPIACR